MVERVFLTDERRKVLAGDYEGPDATKRSHKSRIRSRARLALEELTEVAESPVIDSRDVFDPEDVRKLLQAIMLPDRRHIERGGLFQGRDHREIQEQADDLDLPILEADEDWLAYQDRLYVQLDSVLATHRSG